MRTTKPLLNLRFDRLLLKVGVTTMKPVLTSLSVLGWPGVGTGVGVGVGTGVGVGVGSVAPVIVMVMAWVELSVAVRVKESLRESPSFSALTVVLALSRV